MTAVPDHDTHDLFDVFFFGCTMGQYRWVHRLLDHPWVRMFQEEHRKIMHDEKAVQWIEQQYGPVAALVARAHIATDVAFSEYKKRNRL